MTYQELIILLPCHSLEDFPTYHSGEDAENLLASWSAMWHPVLIHSAQAIPTWARVDSPPADLSNRLLIVPNISLSQLPSGFAERAKVAPAVLLRKLASRDELVTAALNHLEGVRVDGELAEDFMALGFAYLLVQLLTRQMRYSSSLDEIQFAGLVVAAATAVVQGECELAKEKLQACFEILAQERDRYYPVTAYLLDWTLVSTSTIGSRLERELGRPAAMNLQLDIKTLDAISDQQPLLMHVLRERFAAGTLGIALSEADELRLPVLALESVLRQISAASRRAEALLQRPVRVYGRRRFGMSPQLPQILHKLGYQGVLHATLDQGRAPQGTQCKTRWSGLDGALIEMLGTEPLDGNLPATFLSIPSKLGSSMDSDHVATLSIAHWPDHACIWYDALRRVARYSHALGKFVTFEQYFSDADHSGYTDRFEVAQYQSPYLQQAIIRGEPDPISNSVRYWRAHAATVQLQALHALTDLVRGRIPPSRDVIPTAILDEHSERLPADFEPSLLDRIKLAAADFAAVLPRSAEGTNRPGCLIVNPFSCVRRTNVVLDDFASPPDTSKPVYSAATRGQQQQVVVDVPSFGYAWLEPAAGPTTTGQRKSSKREPLIAEDNILRNEFFEAIINSTTGSLQAIREYGARSNRLSQQLVYRASDGRSTRPSDENDTSLSVMAADTVETVGQDSTFGAIRTSGRLLLRDGTLLAHFKQHYQLWRGSRVLQMDLELLPVNEPPADPWNAYYACRYAWGDETAEVHQTVHESRQLNGSGRFESPLYVDVVSDPQRTTILTGGVPFHRRVGNRMLDSLLITRGETGRRFRLGIGIDLAYPHHDALALLVDPIVVPQVKGPLRSANYAWLMYLDNRNMQATHLEPIADGSEVKGFRMRLLECTGTAGRVAVSSFRPLREVRQVDFRGQLIAECAVEKGVARLELAGHEWMQIEALW